MSKKVAAFFEELKSGDGSNLVETIQAIAPGLSLSKIFGDIGQELAHMGSQGSHELAAALFNGNAFVMYPKAGQEDPQHGLSNQADIERDMGREM
jgi:hypothetical protein